MRIFLAVFVPICFSASFLMIDNLWFSQVRFKEFVENVKVSQGQLIVFTVFPLFFQMILNNFLEFAYFLVSDSEVVGLLKKFSQEIVKILNVLTVLFVFAFGIAGKLKILNEDQMKLVSFLHLVSLSLFYAGSSLDRLIEAELAKFPGVVLCLCNSLMVWYLIWKDFYYSFKFK
jgi:hypothetical protein